VIEKWGMGTLNIIDWCKENGNPKPTWEVRAESVVTTYTFKKRPSMTRTGRLFTGFLPAVGDKAIKKIQEKLMGWNLHKATERSLKDIAGLINPTLRGWINYYGSFYKSELDKILRRIDCKLTNNQVT